MVELGLSQTISLKLREIWVFLPGDYEFDTFTVSRNNDDVSIIFLASNCWNFVLQLNLDFLMVEQGVTCKAISVTFVFKSASQ